MLTLQAPAKINLTLEVLGKRRDGFHEIRSVIQSVGLYDTLTFRPSDDVAIESNMPGWTARESLVSKAVDLMKDTTGCSEGACIGIEKRIPLMAGLGGDSSDAAAALRGLNRLWGLNLPPDNLRKFAGQLGSDVYFFLIGGTALVEGKGEIVNSLPPSPSRWVILAKPPVPALKGKTRQLYDSLEVSHYTEGTITQRLVEEMEGGGRFEPSLLFNTFENVAFTRFFGLDVAREHFLKLGAPFVHLAGSGPTLYTMLEDKNKAEELCVLLGKQRMESYLAKTPAEIEKAD